MAIALIPTMKIKYRYKVVLSFMVVLAATTLLFTLLMINKEGRLKIERLVFAMQPYADILYNNLSHPVDSSSARMAIESLDGILPAGIRVTILDKEGWVFYDNFSAKDSITGNHLHRPEIMMALSSGSGHALRYSSTLNAKYLYYAKEFPDLYIRTAMDYKKNIYPAVKGKKSWQAYLLLIFAVSVLVLAYISRKLSKPYYALKEFVERVRHNEDDYDSVRFPKDELGEVGEQIMQAFREMDNSKRYKQQLTHNVAHELKTPVTGIRGYLETLLQEEEMDKEQSRFFLERAYSQTLRLTSIINDISVLNKIEEGYDKFEFEKINLLKCLKDIEGDLAFKLEEKKIRFYAEVRGSLEVEGNYMLIYSLFKNLIDNSIDHAGEGLEIHIKERGVSDSEVYLSYYDTGKGVPEDHIHRIFERFYRVEKGRSRKSGGSGLGLSIVKNSVLLHKGKITASNRSGGGLQFDFTLSLQMGKS